MPIQDAWPTQRDVSLDELAGPVAMIISDPPQSETD
jgi:hypothetical protein